MKKIYLTLTFMLLYTLTATAQPGWQWGKRGGGASGGSSSQGPQEGRVEMVTDKNGNVYVLAELHKNSGANIDGYSTPFANEQLSLTKWDCNGSRKWTKFFGAPNSLRVLGNALGIDTLGGVYFTGTSSVSAYFDADTTRSATDRRLWFIVKYDTAGNFQWLRTPQPDTVTTTASQSAAIALDVAPNGDLYILSRLAPGVFGGAYVSTAHSIHLLRFDKNGNLLNGKLADITLAPEVDGSIKAGNLTDLRTGFARNHRTGHFYISGLYQDLSNYGTLQFGSTLITSAGMSNNAMPMYLAAFDSSGNSLWVEQSAPSGTTASMYTRPQIDEMGNIYICSWGRTTPNNTFFGHSASNLFILSVDPSGNLRWGKNGVIGSGSQLNALAYSNGVLSVSDGWGQFLSWGMDTLTFPPINAVAPVQLTRFNANTGVQLKNIDTFRIEGIGSQVTELTADKKGNFYVGGAFSDKIYLPSGTLTSIGGYSDFFVVKYGSSNCNCTLAVPDFSGSSSGGSSVSFTYTGTTPVDSVRWEFGDGSMATGLTASHTYSNAGTYGVSIAVYNNCGIVVHYKDITTGTTGIAEQDITAVSIYPNPAQESIIIEGAGIGTTAELYNTSGQRVLSAVITDTKQAVNVSSLSTGMYIIHFTTKEGNKGSVKMLKE